MQTPPLSLRALRLVLALLIAALLGGELASAKLPSLRSRFSNLPCLAPIIRKIDPEAPKDIEEAMVLPPYQAPRKLENVGEVSFPVTSESPDAQAWFNQGMAMLHAFWYLEAERCFRQVVYLDNQCPMAFLGLALANELRPKVAEIYVQRALYELSRRSDVTPREKQWIKIFLDYYNPADAPLSEATDEQVLERRRARIRAFEDLAYENPEDIEARAFLLRHLTLDEHRAGVPITSHLTADTLAQQIHALNPRHPSRHYRSFLWLSENPRRAVDTAAQNVEIAPGVPDMWRYSAQVFDAARDFENAIYFGEAAVRAGHAYMERDFVMPDDAENLSSNYAALIDTLASAGKVDQAVEIARDMVALPRSAHLNSRATFEDAQAGTFFTGRRLLAETLMRHERWQQLIDECESPHLDPGPGPEWEHRAHLLYWKAIAALNLDQLEEADATQQELDELFREFRQKGTTNEVKEEIVRCIRSLRTYRALYTGELREAPDFDQEPLLHVTKDHLSRLLFKAGLQAEALAAAAADRAERPGQALANANYCDLHYRAGSKDRALLAFDSQFRRSASLAEPDVAVFNRLKPIVEHLQIRGNWKLPPVSTPETADSTPLPELESVGPMPYRPPAAPPWSLPDHTGKEFSLESYRGKPVLLIFFLGVGCPFCMEQLNIFAPHVEQFEKAGIPLVAISIDTQEGLAQSFGGGGEGTSNAEDPKPVFPFPVVADGNLDIFKDYRVFDDFEDKPMHGTYLIGPDGRILWSDVSHEPFMFPEFLLHETQRLLEREGAEPGGK